MLSLPRTGIRYPSPNPSLGPAFARKPSGRSVVSNSAFAYGAARFPADRLSVTPAAHLQAALDLMHEVDTVARPADAIVSAWFRARRYIQALFPICSTRCCGTTHGWAGGWRSTDAKACRATGYWPGLRSMAAAHRIRSVACSTAGSSRCCPDRSGARPSGEIAGLRDRSSGDAGRDTRRMSFLGGCCFAPSLRRRFLARDGGASDRSAARSAC